MPTKKKKGPQPILMHIGNFAIREDNYIQVRYNQYEYARIAKLATSSGLSMAKIIALSSQPCAVCGNDHVAILIPLGILSARKQISGEKARQNKIEAKKSDNKK